MIDIHSIAKNTVAEKYNCKQCDEYHKDRCPLMEGSKSRETPAIECTGLHFYEGMVTGMEIILSEIPNDFCSVLNIEEGWQEKQRQARILRAQQNNMAE